MTIEADHDDAAIAAAETAHGGARAKLAAATSRHASAVANLNVASKRRAEMIEQAARGSTIAPAEIVSAGTRCVELQAEHDLAEAVAAAALRNAQAAEIDLEWARADALVARLNDAIDARVDAASRVDEAMAALRSTIADYVVATNTARAAHADCAHHDFHVLQLAESNACLASTPAPEWPKTRVPPLPDAPPKIEAAFIGTEIGLKAGFETVSEVAKRWTRARPVIRPASTKKAA